MTWFWRSQQIHDKEMQQNLDQLGTMFNTGIQLPTYTVATRPTGLTVPTIIFVSDGGAGAVFQGWNGAAWVNLG